MISSQMWKGILEGCILRIISRRETYGYEICQRLRSGGFGEISEGTIYPLLLRLEKNGAIAAVYQRSPSGPRRKYFTITEAGRAELERFQEGWRQVSAAVEGLWRKET